MSLKLMFITNRPDVARIAEDAGVDRIFVDMEFIGKANRQGGMDSVQNHHTVTDVRNIRNILKKSELLVRVNPIHNKIDNYYSSEQEIADVIEAGADIVMLPFFQTVEEVKRFVSIVNHKAKVMLLIETPKAVDLVDQILEIPGIDEIHIGINDMSIGYGKKFMFELLTDGTVESLCLKFRKAKIPYGFGGVASIGTGKLPAEAILKEHYRLGSSMVILSRSFCNVNKDVDINYIKEKFEIGIRSMRAFENEISIHSKYFLDNELEIARCVDKIVDDINHGKTNASNE